MTDIPDFTFSEEEIAKIKESLGTKDVEPSSEPIVEPPRRRRGRPKGSTNKPVETQEVVENKTFPPAPLTKREEREVAVRIANILTGATGMAGVVKPYIPMTDEEANAIAEPLASYLIRNEPTSGIAREILENYDLLAMTLGVGSYVVRVYSDRKAELRDKRPDNTAAIQRISERQVENNEERSDEGASSFVSISDVTRGGNPPFDL